MELIKYVKVKLLIAQSCPTLCDFMDYSSPGSSVHGILQARILEWVAIPFSRGSSQPRGKPTLQADSLLSEPPGKPSEMESIKDVKGLLNLLGWLFWLLLSDSRIISLFGEREIPAWYFSKSQSNKWIGAEELRRKGCILWRKQKEIGSETGTSWDSLEIPTNWTILELQSRGCFTEVGLSTRSVALVSLRIERASSLIWRNVSAGGSRRRIGKSPCSSLKLHHSKLRGHWKGWLEGWRHLEC